MELQEFCSGLVVTNGQCTPLDDCSVCLAFVLIIRILQLEEWFDEPRNGVEFREEPLQLIFTQHFEQFSPTKEPLVFGSPIWVPLNGSIHCLRLAVLELIYLRTAVLPVHRVPCLHEPHREPLPRPGERRGPESSFLGHFIDDALAHFLDLVRLAASFGLLRLGFLDKLPGVSFR